MTVAVDDQRRLHVAKVTIEFEFAFIAIPSSADVPQRARAELQHVLRDLDVRGLSDIEAHTAESREDQPPADGDDDDDDVYGLYDRIGNPVRWRDAVVIDRHVRQAATQDEPAEV